MKASLRTLIAVAVAKGRASASDGRWTARADGGRIIVRHFSTDMIAVDPVAREVFPISRGWGSMTDKCGVGRILSGFGIHENYGTVFGGQS